MIETIGHYDAQTDPSTIVIDEERARNWLARGAQPSNTVRKLLSIQGIENPDVIGAGRADMASENTNGCFEYLAKGLVDHPERWRSSSSRRMTARAVPELCVGARRTDQCDRPRRAGRPPALRTVGERGPAASEGLPRARRRHAVEFRRGPVARGGQSEAPAVAPQLPAGRVGRPHGLDGSFYVTRPKPRLLGEGAAP